MKKYKIIEITDNNSGSDGRVIIVKANAGKNAPGYEHLNKMFGKEYYIFSMRDDSETEIFVYPYSKKLVQSLVAQARSGDSDNTYWEPDDNEFFDSNLLTDEGEIKTIHKHISFNTLTSPLKYSVDYIDASSKKTLLRGEILTAIKKHVALDEIANTHSIYFDELLDIIEEAIFDGEVVDIRYFLEDVMDMDIVTDIYGYFALSSDKSVISAQKELDEDYSEDEIRLVRIQYLSDDRTWSDLGH